MNKVFAITSNLHTQYTFKFISKKWTDVQDASG